LKILILNWRDIKHPRAGGAEIRLHEVYSPLAKQGHKIILYSCSFLNAPKLECLDGIEINRLGSDWTFVFQCFFNLRKWINLHKPDIVVEDLNKLPFYSPIIYNGPLLIQMHHLWGKSIFKEAVWPLALFIWLSEKTISIFYRRCQFSVVSPSTKKELVKLGIDHEKIKVIYNGADLKSYYPSTEKKEHIIFWIGRMQKYKGPIEACKILELIRKDFPTIRLVMAGDGPYRKNVEKYAKEKSLPIEFLGFIEKEDKINWLQKSSIHLQSSYKEGWGLTVIEANACGCPVVANNTAGLCDSCKDEENGLLYRYNDIDDAAQKIRNILNNESLSKTLVENGLKRASSFSWKKNCKEIADLLKKIIRDKNEV